MDHLRRPDLELPPSQYEGLTVTPALIAAQIEPGFAAGDGSARPDWTAAIKVGRTYELEPSAQVPLMIGVLQRAQSLPNPPKVTFVIEAGRAEGKGYVTSLDLEWGDGSPMTEVEIDFVRWVSGLHSHLTAAPAAAES